MVPSLSFDVNSRDQIHVVLFSCFSRPLITCYDSQFGGLIIDTDSKYLFTEKHDITFDNKVYSLSQAGIALSEERLPMQREVSPMPGRDWFIQV